MKVIIQIPCFNEEETLPGTLADLPQSLPGVDAVEWLIIDDGSTDRTVEVAREHGVHHVVRFSANRGLAYAFEAGLDACLRLGADVIVNTDGDNQYRGADIGRLVAPIIARKAEMVVGDRQTETIEHFSWVKKKLQRIGSGVVRRVSRTDVQDATSGFRAFSREFALGVQLSNQFTYTLETIMQAGARKMAVASVPIGTNPKTRESRLFKGIREYVRRSFGVIVRVYTMHQPLKAFALLSVPFFLVGVVLGLRFLYFYLAQPEDSGHTQSLVVAAILVILGAQILFFGLIGDLIAATRRLQEETLRRVKRLEYEQGRPQPAVPPATHETAETVAAGAESGESAPAPSGRAE